jgi:aspartate aminotransferase
MPKISQKGQQMPASPIRKLTPFADKAKLEGKKVYHLNIGQPDIETPEGMLNAIKNIDFKVWAYTPSEGTLAIAKNLQNTIINWVITLPRKYNCYHRRI